MNIEAKKELERILAIPADQLSEDEIGFLRARRSYLKEPQIKEYQSVLESKPPKETENKNAKTK